jgi:hypothetical protein
MTFGELRTARISLMAFGLGIAIIVALARLTQYLPAEYYFSFAGFLFQPEIGPDAVATPHWLSLVIKLVTPVVAGAIVGSIWRQDGVDSAGPAGLSAALLLCWPGLVEWQAIAHPLLLDRRNQYLVLYVLYMGSFAYFCAAGARLGLAAREWVTAHVDASQTGRIQIDWGKIATDLLKSGILAAASFGAGHVFK